VNIDFSIFPLADCRHSYTASGIGFLFRHRCFAQRRRFRTAESSTVWVLGRPKDPQLKGIKWRPTSTQTIYRDCVLEMRGVPWKVYPQNMIEVFRRLGVCECEVRDLQTSVLVSVKSYCHIVLTTGLVLAPHRRCQSAETRGTHEREVRNFRCGSPLSVSAYPCFLELTLVLLTSTRSVAQAQISRRTAAPSSEI
jgi:hypothetical protein